MLGAQNGMNQPARPNLIETARLVLRPFEHSDIPALTLIAGVREIADTTISVPHPFTDEDAKILVEQSVAGSGDRIGLAIREGSSDALLGYVGLHHIDHEHEQAEISFWIDLGRQGEGIAREAATAMLAHAFGELRLNRVEAYYMVRNSASGRLLDSLGFFHEGLLRERVFKWGVREDVLLCALLEADWRNVAIR